MLSQGTKLGPYEVIAQLGAGGMGEVYRARDTRLEREVAVKVLPASLASDADRLRRFEQEARAVAALNHPNILAIHDIGSHQGSPYLVSELLEGETLRERLGVGALVQRKVIDYAVQIAKGLAAAHGKGIIHRDLKPENLFLIKDGRVKILDFGLAKLTRPEEMLAQPSSAPTTPSVTDPGVVLGTVGYMSPEQVKGKPAGARSDIFALGAILYEMLSGQRAFHRDSNVETMSAILKEEPPDLSAANRNISPALERVVSHCMEKNPDERFQSARDLAFDLEAISGVSGATAAEKALAPARSLGRRLEPALIAFAFLVTLAAGFFLGRRTGQTPPASFHRLTFRRGFVTKARFAADQQTIVYGAAWDGNPKEIFSTAPGNPGSRQLGLADADLLAISSSGELAILLHPESGPGPGSSLGRLARVPLTGGAPRELLDEVVDADWSRDGTQLAVVHKVGGQYRLEYPIGKVLYQTSGWISFPRVSPDGQRMAFLDHPVLGDDAGSVAVVGLKGEKLTLSTGFQSEQGVAWSPTGDEVWFTGAREGNMSGLFATNLSGREREVLRMAGPINLGDISREGRVLLQQANPRVGIISLAPGATKERDLSWLDWSRAMDLSADGNTLLFDETGEGGGSTYNVYLRKTDGSPAVRLGDGNAQALSPDGKWAISIPHGLPLQLHLLPTGAGEERALTHDDINHLRAKWFPDGKRILFAGHQPGKGVRLYVQDLEGSPPRAITPEGMNVHFAISPDGRRVAAVGADGRLALYPVEGGEARQVSGVEPGELPIQWTSDGRGLFIFRSEATFGRVFRLEVATGRRQLWKELKPSDPAGVTRVMSPAIIPDGKAYAYSYGRTFADLYLVEGLR